MGLLALAGCGSTADRELQLFVAGDIENSIAINRASGNDAGVACGIALRPVGMASPDPTRDGVLTLWARQMALDAAIDGPCATIIAKLLLQLRSKVLPF